jgi:segregation and condensation protein B
MPDPEAPSAAPDETEATDPLPEAPLAAILEAILFACEEPVTAEDLASILGEDRRAAIEKALAELTASYDDPRTGLRVQRIAGGFRITTDPRLAPFVREMVRWRNRRRLSRAALETLALVAYKQPITGPEIQEIRGVNPSSILASLLDHRMVRILGRKKVVGKPFLYGTTQDFLVRFGLDSLDDLPSMEEFDQLLKTEGLVEEATPLHPALPEAPETIEAASPAAEENEL